MAADPLTNIIDQIDRMEPGVLRVFRDSDKDIGFREAILFVDSKEAAVVPYRKWVEIPVPAGRHTLHAHNRLFGSERIEFDIKPGERITFQVANVGGWLFAFFMLLQMGAPRIVLTRDASLADSPNLDRAHRI